MNLAQNLVTEFRDRLFSWGEQNLRDYPWRKTNNPYQILVAEFLLQKTDADTVVSVYQNLLSQYPTIEKLSEAKVKAIAEIMRSLFRK